MAPLRKRIVATPFTLRQRREPNCLFSARRRRTVAPRAMTSISMIWLRRSNCTRSSAVWATRLARLIVAALAVVRLLARGRRRAVVVALRAFLLRDHEQDTIGILLFGAFAVAQDQKATAVLQETDGGVDVLLLNPPRQIRPV